MVNTKIKLAQGVVYESGEGKHQKAAIVVGTPESMTGNLAAAVKNNRCALMVLSPTGRLYHRIAVQGPDGIFRRAPLDEVLADAAEAEAANLDSELHDLTDGN